MDYVLQSKKTLFHDEEKDISFRLIGGYNCVPETAFKEFMATKIQHGKDTGVFYKHYVQSFHKNEKVTPQQVHDIGMELAKYFVGFEVLVATHIDNDHWHSHFIVNSVNAKTGLKIQFNEKSLRELRNFSDKICLSHGLKVLKPHEKTAPVATITTREYRAAEKGESWKFKLISAIDAAEKASRSKVKFIENMGKMGYGVKWEKHHKYITYTTPTGMKCRDNRLHDAKYLKEEMEMKYGLREVERVEPARKSVGRVPDKPAVLRNTTRNIEQISADVDRNSEISSTNAGEDFRIAHMGGLGGGHSAEDYGWYEAVAGGSPILREQASARLQQSSRGVREEDFDHFEQQAEKDGGQAPSEGQHAEKANVEVDFGRSGVANSALRLAEDIAGLFAVTNEQEQDENEQQRKKTTQKDSHKKKKSLGHEMSL